MDIVLATSNKGKVREIMAYFDTCNVKAWSEYIEPFEIIEDGSTFQENALIKSKAVYKAIDRKDIIVLSDDSGISVPLLGGIPGIYSARYAGVGANAKLNTAKLVQTLKNKRVTKTKAFYTAAVGISCKWGDFSVHGFMYGDVIDEIRGDKGFGYDPIFIPLGYKNTLGELEESEKLKISHRTKALKLAKIILNNLPKGY